ncbi:DNA polymerase III subunit gamma and tau [Rarobacter incanus]|uniref:DNA polymerase III subunit gamma and tau n=1 Tax=Rarobacter incanus TaxID=153494 RepID=UPI00114DF2D0|nr:DNA polymerase III subunit gamma and tau [Rarobacter incanus]
MSEALYRRYRPETFEEVIGQEHVTVPLMRGLEAGRVNHAYLFSGPRGCGKTTSARILARVLNCAENTEGHHTADPCGKCESCIELGRGGSGSLDVVEIDAASHGGVDDARDLRERATFSPSRDRYKIFILDEAHMVTSAGFNALLKIVEEPPPYLKFIFATTEPEKVIGTIRSRTHHYPFRLVPPEVLQPYLEQVCGAERIAVDAGVLPLVVRAGGGSVRDSLSVLDQLMAGAENGTITYELAAGLLGFTPVTLIDDVVEALTGRDGARLFRIVEQVIATGLEPRRFVEDLLERFRDLLVLAVSGEQGDSVFRGYPSDQVERMQRQASAASVAQLSAAADTINGALTEMVGATSPRLHLELLCARLLVPAGVDGIREVAARVDALEAAAGTAAVAGAGDRPADGGRGGAQRRPAPTATVRAEEGGGPRVGQESAPRPASRADALGDALAAAAGNNNRAATRQSESRANERRDEAAPHATRPPAAEQGRGAVPAAEQGRGAVPAAEQGRGAAPAAPRAQASADVVRVETEVLARRWDDVLAALSGMRKATWALVSQSATVGALAGDDVTLLFPSVGLLERFRSSDHAALVAAAIEVALGAKVNVRGDLRDGRGDDRGGRAASGGPAGGAAGGPGAADGRAARNTNNAARGGPAPRGGQTSQRPPANARREAVSGADPQAGQQGGSARAPQGAQREHRSGPERRPGATDADHERGAGQPRRGAQVDYDAPEPPGWLDEPAPEPEVIAEGSRGSDHVVPQSADKGQPAAATGTPRSAVTRSAASGISASLPPIPVRRHQNAAGAPAGKPATSGGRVGAERADRRPHPAERADRRPAPSDQDVEEAWSDDGAVAMEDSGLLGAPLIMQMLDGVVIDEVIENER